HNFLQGISNVDYELLRTIKILTRHLEVSECSLKQWEQAIFLGFKVWHQLKEKCGGRIVCNMYEKTMVFEESES
ncbi:MAG: nucleotide pyrophosphohydrolase, partial [Spirochaetota bacterium]